MRVNRSRPIERERLYDLEREVIDSAVTLKASLPGQLLRFRLRAHCGGLFVERFRSLGDRCRTAHAMRFRRVSEFLAWTHADPLRFEFPVLFEHLRRDSEHLARSARE